MRFFCIFPVKKNRIFFESYKGKSYSCNPKYISEFLGANYPGRFELVWVFINPDKELLPKGIKVVKKHSVRNFYYHMTAKVIISNMTDDVFIPKRRKQVHINTWHAGGAYKKVGLSYEKTMSPLTVWQDNIVSKETSYYVSSSELFTKYNIREAYRYDGEVICSGLPRNDLFFDSEKMAGVKKRLAEKLGVAGRTVVLYAPTFRGVFGDSNRKTFCFPYEQILQAAKERQQNLLILSRAHYSEASEMDKSLENVEDVTDYPDMQELLAIADVLVTDYSSSIWDFSLMKKPCVLYVPDAKEYLDERGTYTPIESWPGIVASTIDQVVEMILEPNYELSRRKAEEALLYFGSYEDGRGAETVCSLINEVVYNE